MMPTEEESRELVCFWAVVFAISLAGIFVNWLEQRRDDDDE